ncbi:hypothetical protein [Bradyrhizobium liaoningense]|uniref:hypothetical protein n=1 Tax=Bradyrhizobium liaoningense TaxID=43992 RepID=UPI001BA5EF19|nr:hypothetical protein [Bradyrhizobium liaoningense]MBR0907032.1 hypothetical protein [Bradyrhizobium liaoningense]
MTEIPYLDQPPTGWFPLDIMQAETEQACRDWVALMVDVDPEELGECICKIAFLYIDPKDYHPDGSRAAQEAWVRVPGKHRTKNAAWEALLDMLETRH